MHLVDLGDRYTYIHTYLCSYKIVIAGFGGGLNWEQGGLFVILNSISCDPQYMLETLDSNEPYMT